MHRLLGRAKENEGHAVARWYTKELPGPVTLTELRCLSNDVVEFLNKLPLLADEEF
jgi:hypothetical protein